METGDRASGTTHGRCSGKRVSVGEVRRRRHRAARVLRLAGVLALLLPTLVAFGVPTVRGAAAPATALDWPYYGNDPGGMRYVDTDQVTPANVAQLQPAWIFHTTVMSELTSFESQPIESMQNKGVNMVYPPGV